MYPVTAKIVCDHAENEREPCSLLKVEYPVLVDPGENNERYSFEGNGNTEEYKPNDHTVEHIAFALLLPHIMTHEDKLPERKQENRGSSLCE
jgi:hypothetical protein